jgi:hypothetical protein
MAEQAMNHFEKVEATFGNLEYMNHAQATFLRDFIVKHDARDILELGESSGPLLGEHQTSVDLDVEDTQIGWDQHELVDGLLIGVK